MKTIETKNNASPQTTTSREQAHAKVQSENKNFSSNSNFRNPQTQNQPCLSFLYAISDATLPRSEKQNAPQVPAPRTHQMCEEDKRFLESGFVQARKITKDFLSFLISYDTGISPDDAQILCCAVNAIERSSA